jgi:hypothetical protein
MTKAETEAQEFLTLARLHAKYKPSDEADAHHVTAMKLVEAVGRCLELEAALAAIVPFAELALGELDFKEVAPGRFMECSDAIKTAHDLLTRR